MSVSSPPAAQQFGRSVLHQRPVDLAKVRSAMARAARLAKVVDEPAARDPIQRVVVRLMGMVHEMLPGAEAACGRAPDGRTKDILRATIDHSRSILLQSEAGVVRSTSAQLTLLSGACRLLLRYQVEQ